MAVFLEWRERIADLYRQYEIIIRIVLKFIILFLDVLIINSLTGYNESLSSILFALIIGIIGALVPSGLAAALLALVVAGQLYSLSIVAAGAGIVLFLLLALIYLRFSSKDTWIFLISPILFAIRIPYLLPLLGGLLFTPMTIIPVTLGTMYYYFLRYLRANEGAVDMEDIQQVLEQVRFLVDGIMKNKELMVTVIAFAMGLLILYTISRRKFQNAWPIGIIGGAVVELLVLIAGGLMTGADVGIIGPVLGVVISCLITFFVYLVRYNLDYQSVENVQFEDDSYYYYVKAVPKTGYEETIVDTSDELDYFEE